MEFLFARRGAAATIKKEKEKASRCVAAKVCEGVCVDCDCDCRVVSFFKVIHGWRFVCSVPHLGSLAEWMHND